MPRDPFFDTRAAEIAANIVLAELDTFRRSVFKSLDCLCNGEVVATTRTGTVLTLKWNVDHQCIEQLDQRPMLVELAA